MKKHISYVLAVLLLLTAVYALPIDYTVTAIGYRTIIVPVNTVQGNQTTVENQTAQETWSSSKNFVDDCDNICDFPLQKFSKPSDVTIKKYAVSSASKRYTTSFLGTGTNTTTRNDDKIHVEIQQIKPEDVFAVDKVVPTTLSMGTNQVNVLLRNTFGEELTSITVEITGSGIKTLSALPIAKLAANDKDYVFVTVQASEAGPKDVIIKVTANTASEVFTLNYISQLTVSAPEEKKLTLNATLLASQLADIKSTINGYENQYLDKKAQGYLVSEVYDSIKQVKDNLQQAQLALTENRLEDTQKSLSLAKLGLDDVKNGLANARTEQKSLVDKIKDNAVLITTVAAAIAVIVGFIEHQHKKFKEIRERIAQRRKEAEKAAKKKRKK